MTNQDHIEEIERYLSGKMDLAGKNDFEKRMKADAALEVEVAAYRQLNEDIDLYIEDSLQQAMATHLSARLSA